MFLQEGKKKLYIRKWKEMVKDIIQQVCRIAEKKQNWASMSCDFSLRPMIKALYRPLKNEFHRWSTTAIKYCRCWGCFHFPLLFLLKLITVWISSNIFNAMVMDSAFNIIFATRTAFPSLNADLVVGKAKLPSLIIFSYLTWKTLLHILHLFCTINSHLVSRVNLHKGWVKNCNSNPQWKGNFLYMCCCCSRLLHQDVSSEAQSQIQPYATSFLDSMRLWRVKNLFSTYYEAV